MDEIERLLELGRMDLEAGYPQYAREYFEKVLALDAANREAIDALARIDELRRKAVVPVEPIRGELVEPPHKVEQKRTAPKKELDPLAEWFRKQPDLNKVVILASILLAFVICCPALMRQGTDTSTLILSTPKPLKVTYMVHGTTTSASLTYETPDGTEQRDVRLPWQRTFYNFSKGGFVYISAQNRRSAGSIRVEIWIGGELWKHAESSGAYVIASVDGLLY